MDLSQVQNKDGDNPIHILCRNRTSFHEAIKELSKTLPKETTVKTIQKNTKGKKADEILSYLISIGFDVNAKNNARETPLDVALQYRKITVAKFRPGSLNPDEIKWFSLLIQNGANITKNFTQWVLDTTNKSTATLSRATGQHAIPCLPKDIPHLELVKTFKQSEKLLFIELAIGLVKTNGFPSTIAKYSTGSLRRRSSILNEVNSTIALLCIQQACKYIDKTDDSLGKTLFIFTNAIYTLLERDQNFKSSLRHSDNDHLKTTINYIAKTLTGSRDNNGINYAEEPSLETPLHVAARSGYHDLVQILVDHPKMDINGRDVEGSTPLTSTLRYMLQKQVWKDERLPQYLGVLRILVYHPQYQHALLDTTGCTTLVRFIKLIGSVKPFYRDSNFYKTILEHTSDSIEVPVGEEYGVIMLLAKINNYKVLEKIFKEKKAELDLRAVTINKRTALHIAARYRSTECVKMLVEREPGLCNMRDSAGNTPLFYVVVNCPKIEVVNILDMGEWDYTKTNNPGENVLQYYRNNVKGRESETIKSILKEKVDKKVKPKARKFNARKIRESGFTQSVVWPTSVKNPNYIPPKTKMADASGIDKNNEQIKVKRVLDELLGDMNAFHNMFDYLCDKAGNSVNAVHDKMTPLMWCVSNDLDEEIIKLFELHGSRLQEEYQDTNGRTALHVAAESQSYECTKTLLQCMSHSAINCPDKKGNTALFYICTEFPAEYVDEFLNYPWDYHHRNSRQHNVKEHYEQHMSKLRKAADEPTKRSLLDALSYYCGISRTSSFKTTTSSSTGDHTPTEHERTVTKWTFVNMNHAAIVQSFTREKLFFDYLIQVNLANPEKVQEWESKTDSEAARDILHYLPKRGPRSYAHFIEALKLGNMTHIVEIIENYEDFPKSPVQATITPPSLNQSNSDSNITYVNRQDAPTSKHHERPGHLDIQTARTTYDRQGAYPRYPTEHTTAFPSSLMDPRSPMTGVMSLREDYWPRGRQNFGTIPEDGSLSGEETMPKHVEFNYDELDTAQQDQNTKL